MRIYKKVPFMALAATVALSFGSFSTSLQAGEEELISQGKKLAFERKKGNCLSCHAMAGGVSPGNIGPPLLVMKARFPDKAALRARIWDPTVTNPNTRMPSFGKNRILSEKEIDLVLTYLYTL